MHNLLNYPISLLFGWTVFDNALLRLLHKNKIPNKPKKRKEKKRKSWIKVERSSCCNSVAVGFQGPCCIFCVSVMTSLLFISYQKRRGIRRKDSERFVSSLRFYMTLQPPPPHNIRTVTIFTYILYVHVPMLVSSPRIRPLLADLSERERERVHRLSTDSASDADVHAQLQIGLHFFFVWARVRHVLTPVPWRLAWRGRLAWNVPSWACSSCAGHPPSQSPPLLWQHASHYSVYPQRLHPYILGPL